MSLRLRLTLLFSSLVGGTLLLFGSLVYGLTSIVLINQLDNLLENQASALTNILRVNSAGQFDTRPLDFFESGDSSLVFQVWGKDRKLQYSRPPSWTESLDPAARLSGKRVFNSTTIGGARMRVLTIPLVTPRGPSGTLQVGVSLRLLDVTQSSLATLLVVLALLSITLAATIASLAIIRALAPLQTATLVATTIIRADDLSRRIPTEGMKEDEIGGLILAFNQALARMEALFDTQRRFVADVSHELRTPLTVIKGEVSLMRRMGSAHGIDEESLASIEAEVDRLTRMVGNLLVLAQAESGKLPLDLKPVELDTILLEVYHQVHTLSSGRLNVQVGEIEQVVAVADRDRIKQVLLNIASNAVQYTPQGGTVSLSLKQADTRARVIVSDTGPGIPLADQPHIFERFYRGEKSRTRSGSAGFGLGLSIAYWIVRNHGGSIDVSSKEGSGTSFIIWLPLKQEEEGLL